MSCSTSDTHGNSATATFQVTVVDTTAPAATVTSPSPDALLTAATSDVVMQVTDVVGVSAVMVNGVAATRTGGTPQAGTWRATVPVSPGNALTVGVSAADAAGNAGTAARVVDNDGIPSTAPAALDRNRLTGADQSGAFSNDFSNGVTAGTLARNGWTARVLNAPTLNGVRVQVSGTSALPPAPHDMLSPAWISRFDVAVISIDCATIVMSSAGVWKQTSPTTWTSAQLPTGAIYSTGSPATAAESNTAPITVNVVQTDAAGRPTVVGTFDLPPGASVDVRSAPAVAGGEAVEFRVLRGVIPVRLGGRSYMLKAGSVTTVSIDRTLPASPVR